MNISNFENEQAKKIHHLNIELLNLLKKQVESFDNFKCLLGQIDKKDLGFKNSKRLEAIESKINKTIENIFDFQISFSELVFPNENLKEKEAKEQFDFLSSFLIEGMDKDEDF